MDVLVLDERGHDWALLGISLSRNQSIENMPKVAYNLCDKGLGHNKFLESIVLWIDVTAPRFWWQQFSTYRIGTSCQSGSTMYTILKRRLMQDDFEYPVSEVILADLNRMIAEKDFEAVKNNLPEGYLQRRIITTNYKTLQNIYNQRKNHKLIQWNIFLDSVLSQIKHPEFIVPKKEA